MAFLANTPRVTRNIIVINIIFFFATLLNGDVMNANFALYYPKSHSFHAWQFFTYMFMHGSFWHILFNMYTLFIFGSVVENMIGEKKFMTLYALCGLGAAGLHMLTSYSPMLGASGAIYGILIAYAMIFPESRLTLIFPPVSMKAKTMVAVFVGIELLTGVLGTSDGVAHFAHLGGMAIGFLLVLYWRKSNRLFDRDIWI